MPMGETSPEVWLLGSGDQSAIFAAYFGCAFSFAHFINDEGGPEIMDAYRQRFRPSERLTAPQASIGVFVVCADAAAEARRLAASRDLWRLACPPSVPPPLPPPGDARPHPHHPPPLP